MPNQPWTKQLAAVSNIASKNKRRNIRNVQEYHQKIERKSSLVLNDLQKDN